MVVTFFSKTDRVPKNRTIELNQEVMLIYRLAEGENFQFAVRFLTRKLVVDDILARTEEYAAELKNLY